MSWPAIVENVISEKIENPSLVSLDTRVALIVRETISEG